ncbi:MAG: 1-deoxy-D-xylulose-5-phosphate synthase [Elusimicrobia bacterium]|nr:1-deoxy-D-xylulose-5-phosphate synthase [Elusimicrobiota bacterium]
MKILDKINGPEDLKPLGYEEVAQLAQECRDMIIETITKRGGHLASNLGIVELTLALHRVFDSPKDKLVWDTSNQCYTHKIVTGRREQFPSIRTPGGLSGFAEPKESIHDTLAAGHAGTGLAYAMGMSIALQEDFEKPYVITIVGDGALTSGTSYEALNNIVHSKPKRLVVVFNDNGWSISENVGWLVHWRNRLILHPTYRHLVETGQWLLEKLPHGGQAWEIARKIKTSVEGLFFSNLIWEEMGFRYLGPIDGHNQQDLEESLQRVKEASKDGTPVVLHVLTHKGRGYKLAEENPCKFHQPGTPSAELRGPAVPQQGDPHPPAPVAASVGNAPRYTYSQVFAKTLIRLMAKDKKIVAISAAMLEGTALVEVKKQFPDRVYDVGIAEEHAVIMAAGMAKAGLRPVVAIYSTFLQRSFDQMIHDVCLQALPVTLCVDRAGLVGDDGKTHQGIYDIAYSRCIPNMTVSAPKDENELQHLLFTAIYSGKPFMIRYPRGMGVGVPLDAELKEIPIGRGEWLREGKDLTLFAYSSMVPVALEAAEILAERGIDCGVANARFAKPIDTELLRQVAQQTSRILTLEEHLTMGGFGNAVLETVNSEAIHHVSLKTHGIPDQFVEQSPQAVQRANLKLDVAGVIQKALELYPELAPSAALRVPAGSSPEGRASVLANAPATNGSKKNTVETVTW